MAVRKTQSLFDFTSLLKDIKSRIQTAQTRAVYTVNAELIRLYWDIGRIIHGKQKQEGWGTAVIPKLAHALHNELPELKGFSERNIKRMLTFYRVYPDPAIIMPQPVAQLTSSVRSPKKVTKSIVPQPVSLLISSLEE